MEKSPFVAPTVSLQDEDLHWLAALLPVVDFTRWAQGLRQHAKTGIS